MLIALGMITFSRTNEGGLNFFQRIIYEVSAPIQWVLTSGVKGIKSLWEEYVFLINTKEKNIVLNRKVAEMESLKTQLEEVIAENRRLRRLLQFKEKITLDMVAAEVIGEDASGWFKTLLINKGQKDGVHKGMVAVTPKGIVGHIIESSSGVSKVLLIIDRNSSVDAFVERSRARVIVEGRFNNTCELKYLSRTADVRKGDRVISSGLDGIFPKGLLIGVITYIQREKYGIFQKVRIRPSVDFHDIEEVNIIMSSSIIGEGN